MSENLQRNAGLDYDVIVGQRGDTVSDSQFEIMPSGRVSDRFRLSVLMAESSAKLARPRIMS